ncbi:VWA domain-containing protein [Desulfatiglans anilini]|uniref:VWA domain-containing protein n=1 Tax=Desulfatiglans anilini TaxID=90728 RepID=UPI0009FC56B3|nr:VWA domain-containing protein [Desulfatiglans anilini]
MEDIREKARKKMLPFATVLVIDSSGSISQEKMERLKGAALSFIREGYLKRDKIGLITFRNHRAEQLMPICSRAYSKQAERYIEGLPSGGGTPLASGLIEALHLLVNEKRKCKGVIPIIMLLSDGKANIPTSNKRPVFDEIKLILKKLSWEKVFLIFVDTDLDDDMGVSNTSYATIRNLLKREAWLSLSIYNYEG